MKLKELFISLGMINEAAANSDSAERALVYDLWKLLKGEVEEEVSLGDVRLVIIAVLRMTHKRLGVESKEESKHLCFTKDEVHKMQSTFNIFYLNRLQHLGRILDMQKQQKALADQHQFKPELNQKSMAIA